MKNRPNNSKQVCGAFLNKRYLFSWAKNYKGFSAVFVDSPFGFGSERNSSKYVKAKFVTLRNDFEGFACIVLLWFKTLDFSCDAKQETKQRKQN